MSLNIQNSKISKSLKSSSNNFFQPTNMATTFKVFNLNKNSKLPSYEWSKDKKTNSHKFKHLWKRQSLEILKKNYIGKGLPCGKVNNLWVLDLDFYYKESDKNPWIKDNCLFTKTFGDIDKYIKDNNIYCVKTISGGYHLYFSYDPLMKQTTCKELHIDTRSDGGYVVAPYTMVLPEMDTLPHDENGKQIPIDRKDYMYNILNHGNITECPADLKTFVLDKVINKDKKVYKKVTNNKIKVINPITEEVEEANELDIDLSVYTYTFTDYILNQVCKTLPDKYFQDYSSFLVFTTALKTIDRKDIWLEWINKRVIDKHFLPESSWNIRRVEGSICDMYDLIESHNKLFCINHILKECKLKNARSMLDYYKYKPVPENTYNAGNIINHRKLGITEQNDNIIFFEEYEDRIVVVQSDTGTGKTTEFKNYICEDPQDRRFLSIVSRISLGKEQTEVFKKAGLECMYHEEVSEMIKEEDYSWKMFEGDNIVITIDSLMKTQSWEDYSGYTIFLDEFNSLIEYLITCPLLNKNRMDIFRLFKKLLKQAERVICCDADINEISLRYLDLMEVEYEYIINEYKHNNNIPAKEIFSFNKFIKEVNNHEKWLICCDSKTQAEIISEIGDKTDYKLITSETKEHVNLDDHDRILYSPKIIYGLDSSMKRPVFCYYKEQTISPVAMVQQICRCRNIEKLYYLFERKSCCEYKYHDYEHVIQDIKEDNKWGCLELGKVEWETGERKENKNEDYVELLSKYIYRKDCYDTNKFAHFVKIIKERGFKNETQFGQTSLKGLKEASEMVKEIKESEFKKLVSDNFKKIRDFDSEVIMVYDIIEEDKYGDIIREVIPEWILMIQELLKIPWWCLDKYYKMFRKPQDLQDHFAISTFFNKTEEEIVNKLKEKNDFACNKVSMLESKLLLIHKYRKLCGLGEDLKIINVINCLPQDKIVSFTNEYKIVFDRCAIKKFPDFTELKHSQQILNKMFNNCFGGEIIDKRKSTKKGKSITYYSFNKDEYDYHNILYKYRNPDPVIEELEFIDD